MARPERPWTLRRRFARLLLFAAAVPAVLFSAVLIWQQYQAERDSLGDRLGLSAGLTSSSIDDYVHSRLASLIVLAQTRDVASDAWPDDLARLLDASPGLLSALVTDHEGRVLAHAMTGPDTGASPSNVSDREYFAAPARTLQPYVSNAFRGRALGTDPLVAISAPIVRDGRFMGVIEASIHVETFASRRSQAFHARGYEMLLLDRRNQVIHTTPGLSYEFLQVVSDPRLTLSEPAPLNTARSRFKHDIMNGGGAFVARARMESGWVLVLLAPDRPLLETIGRSTLALIALLIVTSLGVIAAVWIQLRDLAAGTGRLLDTLRNFAVGTPLDADSARGMPMELRPIAGAIGELSDRLNHAYGELNDALQAQRELATSLQRVVEERDQEIAARTADLRNAVDELERIASIDALTGALNVRGFRREIGELVEDPAHAETEIGALIIDIDHFKTYNDRYGHPAGDTVLKRVAGIMHGLLRVPGDTLARVGGEEFVVLLRDTSATITREVAERFRDAVRDACIPHEDGLGGRVTISIGIASQPSPEFMDRLLSRADEALYRAKRGGRDRVSE
ncbi:sensor domain-containing diguanylate cyclase [Marilutibacter alkalisoli]|uniref:diguanylate cyclase n=1 Tax=Marilutibacter alkalisoli TaxID=2591633 RepID=A0A514BP93_9GAMM|nr:diguanylate cyclase [Lysobacter alkalisoli]QDH69203.1 diguanylate cyclase [Lysobacter alkalisoli]